MKKVICILLSMFLILMSNNVVLANKLPSYDINITPYKKAPWIDGTHFFDDLVQKFIDEHGLPDFTSSKSVREPKGIGKIEEFYVMNIESNQPEKRSAVLRKIGKHCYLYVEEGREYKDSTLQNIVDKFDNVIYKFNTETFGSEPKPGIDHDERITILMVDIKDGWTPGKGFVGGYFFPLDCYSTNVFKYSNEREMVYLDCYPSNPEDPSYLGVIAHEFQHMIHFANDPKEGKWINEGCSQLAFYVCGYDHPSQILSYIVKPTHSATTWNDTLEAYGAVYLLNYYLFQKYAGKTFTEKQQFYKALVSSQLKGIDSINEVLKQFGINKTFEDIFSEWVIANLINRPDIDNKYGYDKSLTMHVHTTHNFTQLPAKIENFELLDHGVANILFTPFVTHLPDTPTILEKFKIYSPKNATIIWGINNWQLPPEKYIPNGSTINNGLVETPLEGPDTNGIFSKEFGPMVGAGLVDVINFKYKYTDGTYSNEYIINLIGPNGRNSELKRVEEKSYLLVQFKGEKPSLFNKNQKFILLQILEDKNKNIAISHVPLKDNAANIIVPEYGKNISKVYFITYPINTKSLKFNLNASLISNTEISNYKDAFIMKPNWLTSNNDKNFQNDNSSSNENKNILNTNNNLINNVNSKFINDTNLNQSQILKSDTDDTAHDNFGYLVWKLKDNIHLLTHLKIDPEVIEGQLLQMYKMLQITMNLPKLPLPDGLAIKDYNCSKIIEWALKLNDQNGTEKDREALKRVINIAPNIEAIYNISLILTSDIFETTWSIVRFIYRSINVVNNVTDNLANVPVVGTIADKAKYKIRAKLVEVINNGTFLVAPHLPPKYGALLPIGVWLLTTIYCGVTNTQLESSTIDINSTKYSFIIKLFGKYVLASLPKIGFVDRTQKYINEFTEIAINHKFEGNLSDCNRFVEAKVNQITNNALDARIKAENSRKAAKFTGCLAQLSTYASVIDPTVISKICALALTFTTAGFYAHAIYEPFKEYLKLDDYMADVVKLQMYGKTNNLDNNILHITSNNKKVKNNIELNFQKNLNEYLKACDELNNNINTNQDIKKILVSFEKVMAYDSKLDENINVIRALSTNNTFKNNPENNELFESISNFSELSLKQATYYGEIINTLSNPTRNNNLSYLTNSIKASLQKINNLTLNKAISDKCIIKDIEMLADLKPNQEFIIKIKLFNNSNDEKVVKLSINVPNIIDTLDKPVKNISLKPNETKTINFNLKSLEPLYNIHDSAILIMLYTNLDNNEEQLLDGKIVYFNIKK